MWFSSYWLTELQHIKLIINFHLDNNHFSSSLLDRNCSFFNPTQNTAAVSFPAWSSDVNNLTLFGHLLVYHSTLYQTQSSVSKTISPSSTHPLTTCQPTVIFMLLTLSTSLEHVLLIVPCNQLCIKGNISEFFNRKSKLRGDREGVLKILCSKTWKTMSYQHLYQIWLFSLPTAAAKLTVESTDVCQLSVKILAKEFWLNR